MLQLEDVLQSYGLEWRQVTSILLDNYAVMRGKKSGLETLARKENPNLLDISGDTVHMVCDSVKALMRPFGSEVEDLCSDIYYVIEKSPKQKIFSQFQSLLHLTPKRLIRPISNRWMYQTGSMSFWMCLWLTTIICWIPLKNTNTGNAK